MRLVLSTLDIKIMHLIIVMIVTTNAFYLYGDIILFS